MYSIQTPPTLFCGTDAVTCLKNLLKDKERIAVFTDYGVRTAGLCDLVIAEGMPGSCKWEIFDAIPPEPSAEAAADVIRKYAAFHADCIVAVGGGSVMDTAKLASLFDEHTDYDIEMLIEHPERAQKHCKTVMIPTTAGTGAEATINAIFLFAEKQMKIGIVCPQMAADSVILDARMTATVPQRVASAACADTLAHAIECFTSKKATPLSDLYALASLQLVFENAEAACIRGEEDARQALLLAAYYGGCAISGSGTTAVHALSYPLGGKYHIPHGISNAILLLPVMRFNAEACIERFAAVYDRLHPLDKKELSLSDKADRLMHDLEALLKALRIPSDLNEYGVTMNDLDWLVKAGMDVKRLINNNPRPVTEADAEQIYKQVLS